MKNSNRESQTHNATERKIKLSSLIISPLNTRKVSADDADDQ